METLRFFGHGITRDLAGALDAVTKRLGEQYVRILAGRGAPRLTLCFGSSQRGFN